MIKGPRFQIVKQFFPNGSIWLLGRQHQELGPAVGGCPGLPHGEAGPGRARLVGFPAAPTGAKGQLLCTGQKGPKSLDLSGGMVGVVKGWVWRKLAAPGSFQPASFACICTLAQTPEVSPTCCRVWAEEAEVMLDTSPVRQTAYGDKEGAAGREVGP